jgi:hypothetical protein
MVRMAFLDALGPEERRAAVARYERTITEEIRRLRSAGELESFRREARRAVVERLEATRRWLRGLALPGGGHGGSAARPAEKKR